MRIFEIILKLLFLVGSIIAYKVEDLSVVYLTVYSIICLTLGTILFFNRKQSYGYELSAKEIAIRKVEGAFLVIFSIFWLITQTI